MEMKIQSIRKQGVTTEDSREYKAGERNAWKAVRVMKTSGYNGDKEFLWNKAHYLVDVPVFVEAAKYTDNAAGDPHVVYGMGFDVGTSDALKSLFGLE